MRAFAEVKTGPRSDGRESKAVAGGPVQPADFSRTDRTHWKKFITQGVTSR